jgi:malate dehydrogenase (oxaloacetate-decarboxylating)(NADP+)
MVFFRRQNRFISLQHKYAVGKTDIGRSHKKCWCFFRPSAGNVLPLKCYLQWLIILLFFAMATSSRDWSSLSDSDLGQISLWLEGQIILIRLIMFLASHIYFVAHRRSTKINAMKMAAVRALAAHKEHVPEQVNIAYGATKLSLTRLYHTSSIRPKINYCCCTCSSKSRHGPEWH